MIRLLKSAFFIVFFSLFALLSGCFDSSQPAPVVDAWYQKGAASNFYIVRRGDTIYSIAFSFGLDYRELAAANNLNPPYPITSGERLIMTHRPPSQTPQRALVTPRIQYTTEPTVYYSSGWLRPAKGRLVQGFSRSPEGHPGISIAGQLGEPIRASASGTVVYSGDGVRGYGNLIIIKHNDSYLSAYAFNQENLVVVGDQIQAGSVIARMGQNDAGRTLLYFEIRRNGVPVNPLRFLQ